MLKLRFICKLAIGLALLLTLYLTTSGGTTFAAVHQTRAALSTAQHMLQPSVLNPSTPCSLTNGQHPTTGCPGTTCAQYPSTTYCDGQDPIAGGCSGDAYTVTSASITGLLNQNGTLKIVTVGEVDLRYSPTCASNWARAVLYTSDSQVQQEIGGFADFNATIKRCTDGKTFTATTSTDAYPLNTNIYGDMVYAPTAPADASATTDFPSSDGDTGCH